MDFNKTDAAHNALRSSRLPLRRAVGWAVMLCVFVVVVWSVLPSAKAVASEYRELTGRTASGLRYRIIQLDSDRAESSLRLRLGTSPMTESESSCGSSHLVEHILGNRLARASSGLRQFGYAASGATTLDRTVIGLDVGGGPGGLRAAVRLLSDVISAPLDPGELSYEARMLQAERRSRGNVRHELPLVFLSAERLSIASEECEGRIDTARAGNMLRDYTADEVMELTIHSAQEPAKIEAELRRVFTNGRAPVRGQTAKTGSSLMMRPPSVTFAIGAAGVGETIEIHTALPVAAGTFEEEQSLVALATTTELIRNRVSIRGRSASDVGSGYAAGIFMSGFKVSAPSASMSAVMGAYDDARRELARDAAPKPDLAAAYQSATSRLCQQHRAARSAGLRRYANGKARSAMGEQLARHAKRICSASASPPETMAAQVRNFARLMVAGGSVHTIVRQARGSQAADLPVIPAAYPAAANAARDRPARERSKLRPPARFCSRAMTTLNAFEGELVANAVGRHLRHHVRFSAGTALDVDVRADRSASASACILVQPFGAVEGEAAALASLSEGVQRLRGDLSEANFRDLVVQFCFDRAMNARGNSQASESATCGREVRPDAVVSWIHALEFSGPSQGIPE